MAAGISEPIIQCHDLWHSYGKVQALRGVDLSIRPGEYVGIIGQNGSGKTTLVKHFNGLLKPTKGRVIVNGLDTRQSDTRELSTTVGYVFQNPDHMLFATSVEEEVALGPKILKLPAQEVKRRVSHALGVTGLREYSKEFPHFFGKGMRRMITLAAILAMEPAVMVIDEPTTGMDLRGYAEVMALIDRLHKSGHTIIVITHDMRLVADHCKRTIVMFEGQIYLDGPTRELFGLTKELERVYLRPPSVTRLAQMLDFGNVLSVAEFHAKMKSA